MAFKPSPSPSRPSISRLKATTARTGLSRAVLYKLKAKGEFPPSIQLSDRSIGWLDSDIDEWINARKAASRPARVSQVAEGSSRRGGIAVARSDVEEMPSP